MKNKELYLLVFTVFSFSGFLVAQEKEHLLQFSGMVVTADSLKPVPFAHVVIGKTGKGAVADYRGFFSFVVHKSDEIIFSAMGYKKASFKIPDTLKTDRLSMVQPLVRDTITLQATVIYPWPNKEIFRQQFLHDKVPADIYEIARRNLENLGVMTSFDHGFAFDTHGFKANQAYKSFRQQENLKLYYKGQSPYNSLLNPFAWVEFFKALKRGDFEDKRQK